MIQVSIRYVLNEVYDRYQNQFLLSKWFGEVDKPDENNFVNDTYRINYLNDHFLEIKKAVEIDRVPVLGYTMWGGIDLVSLSTGEMKNVMAGSMWIWTIKEMALKRDIPKHHLRVQLRTSDIDRCTATYV